MGSSRNSGTNPKTLATPSDGPSAGCRSPVCSIPRTGMRSPMATVARPGPFARKSHDALMRDATADPEHGLKRAVGVLDLTALGIGAVIGTGIFVIIGEAIGQAGPSIIISFALAGVTCLFSAFSYAELASSIPVSGSAYTYGYA